MTAPAMSVSTANGRFYARPGKQDMVPSITNIIGMLDKPALKFWAAKEAANYAADNREKLATLTRDEAQQLVRNAPFQRRDDSPAAIGDIVHNWVDQYVKGNPPSAEEVATSHPTARHMYESFEKFRQYYSRHPSNIGFVNSEFTVWSDKHNYAGTADLHIQLNGMDVLVDTKTGANVYPETAMQLAAIANADFILTPDGQEFPIPRFGRHAILHLRPRSATLVPVRNITEAFECFRALRTAFRWKTEFADGSLGFAPKVT